NAGAPVLDGNGATATFELRAGEAALLTLVNAFGEPLILPCRQACESRLRSTQAFWEGWSSERLYDGPWRDAVVRSALVLKLLIFAPSGASAAAVTTSLPEEI